MLIGLIGAPNQGKSTLFNALTLAGAEMAPHPFTTIKPNEGVAYVKVNCPKESCNPNHGYCRESNRFIPIKVIDVAGLVPEASEGRGLGNQFMNDLSTADAFIIVVDAGGKTGCEGEPANKHNPVDTVKFIINEIDNWFTQVIEKQWESVKKRSDVKPEKLLAEKLAGLGINEQHIREAMPLIDITSFSKKLRELSKPFIICANKSDCVDSDENIKLLIEEFNNKIVIPSSAVIELTLREAELKGFINYIPGASNFNELKDMSEQQKKGLNYVADFLANHKSTGVQECINSAVFKLLKMKVAYPVQDDNKWADSKGLVLPDALLLNEKETAHQLAYRIHTQIGEGFIKAIDARTKKVLGKDYLIIDGDVIKIVSK